MDQQQNKKPKLPVIILTFTPRLRALRMVSALSCLGGSKRGNKPTNCHGDPTLSFVLSGTSCKTNDQTDGMRSMPSHSNRTDNSMVLIKNLSCNSQWSKASLCKFFNHRMNPVPNIFLAVAKGQYLFLRTKRYKWAFIQSPLIPWRKQNEERKKYTCSGAPLLARCQLPSESI